MSKLADAQHEAAHVVVGVALGLTLKCATVKRVGADMGSVEFWHGAREALLLMYAAGLAWERRFGDVAHAAGDLACLRSMRVRGNARVRVLERAAWAVLVGRQGAHTRVTRALLEGDLTARSIAHVVKGHTHFGEL